MYLSVFLSLILRVFFLLLLLRNDQPSNPMLKLFTSRYAQEYEQKKSDDDEEEKF
jgi:hypothetical protein